MILLAFVIISILLRGGKGLESIWLLSGVAIVLTLTRTWVVLRRGESHPQKLWGRCQFLLLLSFTALTVLSYLTSRTQNYGFDEVLMTAALALLAWWCLTLPQGEKEKFEGRFLTVMALTTIVASVIGTCVYVLQPVDRFVGTFFDWRFHTDYWPNAWGEYLLLALPMLLAWAGRVWPGGDSGHRWLSRSVILFGVALPLVSFFLSYSRGSILVMGGEAVLFALGVLLYSGKRPPSPTRIGRWATRSIVVACGTALLFIGINALRSRSFPVQSVADKIQFQAAEGRSSIDERSQFWHQALALSAYHPWFGYGPYSFRFVQPKISDGILATSDHPHNVILKIALERGWPAAGAFLALIVMIFLRSLIHLYRDRRRHDHSASFTRAAIIIGCAGVLVHNLIDYNLQFIGISLPWWIGLSLASTKQDAGRSPGHPPPNRVLHIIAAGLAVVLGLVAVREGYFLTISSAGRHAQARGDRAAAAVWYRAAEGQWFNRDALLSRVILAWDEKKDDAARELIAKYGERNDEDPRYWKMKGQAELRLGKVEEAVASLTEAMRRGGNVDAGIVRAYAGARSKQPRWQWAPSDQIVFEETIRRYAEAIMDNAHYIALSNNVEELAEATRILRVMYPLASADYRKIEAQILEHAKVERERLTARKEGYIW